LAPGASGRAGTLAFTADTPGTAPADHQAVFSPTAARLPVGARVLDPDGLPVAGAEVHFVLESGFPAVPGAFVGWSRLWQVEGVTGADGVARASLPLWATGALAADGTTFRLAVVHDGATGSYPLKTLKPLVLS
jgi:hypothetical protein